MPNPSINLMDPARVAKIRQYERDSIDAHGKPKYGTHTLDEWRGQKEQFPVVRVPIKDLLLNIQNGRTRAEQELAALEAGNPDLFADPTSNEAQEAQKKILRSLDRRKFDDLMSDIKNHGQRQAGVITAAGTLINGNRRRVALEEAGYEYMDVVVLPSTSSKKELFELEVNLQLAKEFKADYSHINRLLMIERLGVEEEFSSEEICSRLRLSLSDLALERGILQLMRNYLLTANKSARLGHLDGQYEAFKELHQKTSTLQAKRQYGRAGRLKNNWFLGIMADTTYRHLRHVGEDFANEYVVPSLERHPELKSLLEGSSATTTGTSILSGFASNDDAFDVTETLIRQLDDLWAQQPPAVDGTTVSSLDGGSSKLTMALTAIREAAKDAAQDVSDESNITKPAVLLKEATAKVKKVQLDTVWNSPGFTASQFAEALENLEKAVSEVRSKYDALKGDKRGPTH